MAKITDASDWADAKQATHVLLRSRIEIVKLLEAAGDAGVQVVACLRDNKGLFISRLLGLSSDKNHLLIGYSDNKAANNQILAAGGVTLWVNYKSSYVEFLACHAVEDFEAGTMICFDIPDALFIQQRRSYHRIALIPGVPLTCLADGDGIMPFSAKVIDVGIGGLGAMVYSKSIKLTPGTLLKGCRITLPDLSQTTVDISIRQVGEIALFEGAPAYRAGCSFVGSRDVIESLVKVFMLDMERRKSES